MTLGRLLATIAETKSGVERESLKEEFLHRARGHKDENLLMDCFRAAYVGRSKYIFFGRGILPPAELRAEGFYLERNGLTYNYCFH